MDTLGDKKALSKSLDQAMRACVASAAAMYELEAADSADKKSVAAVKASRASRDAFIAACEYRSELDSQKIEPRTL